MNRLSRPTALKIAAVLSFLLSASGVIFSLPLIAQGATAVEQGGETPPYFVLLSGLIFGVVGIVAAFGTWKGQRWGIILTILANVVNGLGAAPGLLFAPTPGLLIAASVTVVLSIAIIVLCLWPDRKLATA
jgi:hypothetical protein